MSDIKWYVGMIVTGGRQPGTESMDVLYYITGGVHTDTSFDEIVPGTEESYGPYENYDDAVKAWRGFMGRNIDICEHRLFIDGYIMGPGEDE